jgi:hypothetical protein
VYAGLTTLVLMFLLAFTPSLVSATVQIPDEIVIDGNTRALLTEPEPFERYLNDSGQHAKLQPYLNGAMCSASWRGFRAYWKIADAKLLLVKLLANPCDRQPKEVPLTVFFPDHSGPVLAGWFSGGLLVSLGRRLQDSYLFERYLLITVERGIVINRRESRERPQ